MDNENTIIMNHNIPPPQDCPIFSPCWCAVAGRENNPHCKDSLPINSNYFIIPMIILGILLVFYTITNKIINK